MRLAGTITVAAALAAATAGPADAFVYYPPGCATALLGDDAGTSYGCDFDPPDNYATMNVVTDGSVTITLRCYYNGAYTTTSRSYAGPGRYVWTSRAYGTCTFTLTSAFPGTTAAGTAVTAPQIYATPTP